MKRMEETELYDKLERFNELDKLKLKRGTPECDEYIQLREELGRERPVYCPCEHCGKEDHSGWSDDPREATIMYTHYCSKKCYDDSSRGEHEWLEEIKNRSVDDFPEEMDVQAYTEMSIWVANMLLQDEGQRDALSAVHPLYAFPQFLAKMIREHSLDKIDREFVEFPDRNSFIFTKPVPRNMALKSFE